MARKQNGTSRVNRRAIDFLRDGKKTVLASALALVMAVMWIRVLIGHKPESAAAAVNDLQVVSAKHQEVARVLVARVELPKVPGRNDSIHRDCFNVQDRSPFRQFVAAPDTGTDTEVQTVSPNHDREVIQQVAQTLAFEGVVRSDSPQAFINDRMVGVGDRFTVESGSGSLEFEVLRIYQDAVLVECKGIQMTLKLTQGMEVRK